MAKFTKADMESWLITDGRGIKIVGQYINDHITTGFECAHGHQWDATPRSVKKGGDCYVCLPNYCFVPNLTKSDFESWLIEDGRGINLIGDYTYPSTKTEFKCAHDHRWKAAPGRVKNGSGCPDCASNAKLKKSDIESWLVEDGRGIKIIGDYSDSKTKTTFECTHGHPWDATPKSVKSGSGCPSCSPGGFKPNLPAWEYIFTRGTYLKYGISNKLNRRLTDHKRHGDIEIVHLRQHDIGQHALDWENRIKKTFGGKYVTDALCPDGWTETLPISHLRLLLEEKFIDKIHST